MRVSIAVPNYNYGSYLRETLESVLSQEEADLEVLLSDNASTDSSWEVATELASRDPRLTVSRNQRNLGFAANLDCATRLGTAPWCLTLSSDDLMLPGAMRIYGAVVDAAQRRGGRFLVASTVQRIDSSGAHTGTIEAERFGWRGVPVDEEVSAATGHHVRSVDAGELLGTSLRAMRNPLPFLSTMFPRDLYDAVGGYTAQRNMNPDKWFHWRLLAEADHAYLVDEPMFAYRWHDANQTAQQATSGALKFWLDEYAATFQISDVMLDRAGVTRAEFVSAFLEIDIVRRGMFAVARGDRLTARRLVALARATYPRESRSLRVAALAVAARGGRPATAVAGVAASRLYPEWESGILGGVRPSETS